MRDKDSGILGAVEIDLAKLTALLVERPAPAVRLALLFGSRASGGPRENSDIDLALLCDTPISTAQRFELIGDVGATFGLPVDLVDLYRAPYPVTGEALGGVRLIGDDDTYASLATRYLTDREDFGPLHDRLLDRRLDTWLRT